MTEINVKTCECGCGKPAKPGNRFIYGHTGGMRNKSSVLLERVCSTCSKEFKCYPSSPTIHCGSKCYGITKKGKSLTEKQIQGYKNRELVPWNKNLTKYDDPRLMQLSIDRTGEGNPNYGVPITDEHSKHLSEAMTGIVRSSETRQKMRDSMAKRMENGFNAHSYGVSGRITLDRFGLNLHYRSSYEKEALLLLATCLDVSCIAVESLRITYTDAEEQKHYYIPDFLVTTANNSIYIIEVKPECFVNDKLNQLKFAAARKYAEEHNMIFLVWTEDILFCRNSVTTASLQEIVEATAAISDSSEMMIQSELYSDIER